MTTPDLPEHGPQSESLRAVPVWEPKRYRSGPLVGAGRWVPIFSPVDRPAVGVLATDDQDLLAFVPFGADEDDQQAMTAQVVIRDALLAAAAVGTPVREVFDAWAARDGRGLAAGPVVTGDLRQIAT